MAPERRPQTLAEMADLLDEYGIDPEMIDTCREAAALVDDPNGRSRIGGLPSLPLGAEWPRVEGVALAHVASIRLDDLPPNVRPAADGELSIFIGAQDWWDDAPRPRFAVVHTPAAELGPPTQPPIGEPWITPEDAAGTDADLLPVWVEIPLAARPVVNLDWEAGMPYPGYMHDRFYEDDLDALEALDQDLRRVDPDAPQEGHAVLGAPAASDAFDGEIPVLIQLNSDKSWSEHGSEAGKAGEAWIFNDCWVLLVRGDPDAFRAGDFSSLQADYTTVWYSRGPFDEDDDLDEQNG